jgi:hypothetical protein
MPLDGRWGIIRHLKAYAKRQPSSEASVLFLGCCHMSFEDEWGAASTSTAGTITSTADNRRYQECMTSGQVSMNTTNEMQLNKSIYYS